MNLPWYSVIMSPCRVVVYGGSECAHGRGLLADAVGARLGKATGGRRALY